ncbi:MAG: tetratricopeptide repeat protein [Campylobacteraceae bacterium]|nr:tetratricopeptide repeat protein [Campylobacteraceae bacterium]
MEVKYSCLINAGDLFLIDAQPHEACACYLKALYFKPEGTFLLRVYNNLGVAYKRMGKLEEANLVFQKGISIAPDHTSFYSNLSSLFQLQNNPIKAIETLEKVVSLGGEIGDYIRLSELLKAQNNYKKALDIAIYTVRKFPMHYESHLHLGNLFTSLKLFENAQNPYLKAIEIAPEKTQAYNNIGVVYKELGENTKALSAYQKVLELNPSDPAVHNNLGNLLRNMNDMQGAIQHLERSIALNPKYVDAYSNLGAVYKESKEYEMAVGYYYKALSMNPNHTNANFDLSLIELTKGNYTLGWEKYEHRLKMTELLAKTHIFKKPLWQGEPLNGKTIILQNEQGFGDNIMFIRYAPKFKEFGAHVIIRTRSDLVSLFKSVDQKIEVISEDDAIPEHDFYLPLLSCSSRFKTTLETLVNEFPYLHVKDTYVDLQLDKKFKNIGLVWSSSRSNKDFKNKYIGLENYTELLSIKGTKWYSLQAGNDALQIEELGLQNKLIDLSPLLTDFLTTAKIIGMLDIVITTDTAVAHLCGALNKEAWVLVPRPADWRWMQEGSSTPWYKSLKLFRQEVKGDWCHPLAKLKEELKKQNKTRNKK